MRFDAVLFDLDGTLADTAPDMASTVNGMRERRGLAPLAVELVRSQVSNGARGMLDAAFGIKPDHTDFAAMRQEFLDLYESRLCVDTRLFPGMEALLDGLEGAGLAWGVVTNKYERFARPVLDGLGLGMRSRVIVGGDTCPRPKPFPDSLLHACATLDLAPMKVLYVGDDTRDVQAARAAGMKVIVAGYGYLGGGDPPALWGADAIVDSPHGIGRWLGLEVGGATAAAE